MSALSSTGSRIVLMGTQKCANDAAAPPAPSVESTMDDLADVMVNRCGADPNNIVRVLDAADPMRMGVAVAEAAEQATDVLLVHYVGHGFPGPDGELYLATRATDPSPNRLQHNSLRWDTIRKSLLNSRARTLVVILDCCFSGRAAERTLNAAEPVDLADVHGGYILTAGAREQLALAPKGQRHTAFTGELIRLLRDGDPNSPSELRMRHVYRALDRRLRARSLPPPFQRNIDQAEDLVLAANTSDGTGPSTGARPIAAPRKRRRLLPTLVITAVALVALGAGPVLWFGVPGTPPGGPGSSNPSAGHPAQPQAPASLPPVTACAARSATDNCGELPGRASSRAADGSIVTLVNSSADTVLRYKQKSATEPVGEKTDLGANVAQEPLVVPDARGRLIGFVLDTQGRLRYNPDIGSGGLDWRPIGDRGDMRGAPAAAQDAEGKIVVVARSADGELLRSVQRAPGDDQWDAPTPVPNPGPPLQDDPVIHRDKNKSLRVFALGADNSVYTWAQERLDYADWQHQEVGRWPGLATSPAVAQDGDGRLHLFSRGTDDNLYHFTEDSKVNIWSGKWEKAGLPGPYTDRPFAIADRAGTVTAFTERKDPAERVAYTSVGGSRQDSGKSADLQRPIARILSATIDQYGAVVVQGLYASEVVSAYRSPPE